MFENITRLFSADDPVSEDDSEDDSEDGEKQTQAVDLGSEPFGADEQNDDDGPDAAEVDVRVDELEGELETTTSSIRELQSSQDEIAESIEEMNDTVRQLVGVYDRVTAEENPFVDDPAAPAESDTAALMSDDSAGERTTDFADDGTSAEAAGERAHGGASDDDQVVSFDDLLEQTDDDAAAEHHQPTEHPFIDNPADSVAEDTDSPASESTEAWDTNDFPGNESFETPTDDRAGFGVHDDDLTEAGRYPADTPPRTDRETGQSVPGGQNSPPSSTTGASGRDPVLTSVPQGYAGDILVMEWLATLMDSSGPAGALRAVNHYENMGWISGEVRERLVDVIGGPSLDVFVDPTQAREPTADDHAASHEYLRVLDRLSEI